MSALSPAAVLEAWEAGRAQHPLDRALTLLQAADRRTPRAALAALPVAERDRRLLAVRARTVGPEAAAFAPCPACGTRLETSFRTDSLVGPPVDAGPREVSSGSAHIVYRLPDSRDLAAVAGAGSAEAGRRLLVSRCVLSVARDDVDADPASLSEEETAALGAAMEGAAPTAEILLRLECPACGHGWSAAFDVAAFFWTELSARARRLLAEVDALARAYGWREADILAMSPARRQSYLELVGG